MHVPTLPTKSTWETPIAASREIVGAITDAADSAVDAAAGAVRSVRRRRTARRVVLAQWRWMLATAVVVAALAVWRRRSSEAVRANEPDRASGAGHGASAATAARPDAADVGADHTLVDAGAQQLHGAVVD